MRRFMLAIACLSFLTCLPVLAAQQEGDEKVPDPAAVKAMQESMDALEKALDDKSDVDAAHHAGVVADRWAGGDAKQQKDAVKLVGRLLASKSADIRDAGVDALGRTGGDATKTLLKEAGGREAKKDLAYLGRIIGAIGKLHDDEAIDELVKWLRHRDNAVVSSAVYALGAYGGNGTKVRKEIVDTLLKIYEPLESSANRSNPRSEDREAFEVLEAPFESALRKLTGAEGVKGAPAWGRWYRDEGKKKKEW